MNDQIIYRELDNFEAYSQIEDIQQDSWEVPDRELVPKRIPYATSKSGGIVLGAYKDDFMIGYVWGWVGYNKQEENFIYSHHNAVRKEYQNKGIGFQLKLEQRNWAIRKGFNLIKWVFDPLQTKNCNLNIHKLGATCNTYKNNYWLELKDALNEGIETDRLYCSWDLLSEHVENHVNRKYTDFSSIINNPENHVLDINQKGEFLKIENMKMDRDESIIVIEVPSNFIKMKKTNKNLAVKWRFQTRSVFQNYFDKGYKIIDFVIQKKQDTIRCYHILKC